MSDIKSGFYVTACRDELRAGDRPSVGQRVAWLAGPFTTHQAALDAVREVREICEGITAGESDFWSFGTARREALDGQPLPAGKVNGHLAALPALVQG